MVTGQGVCELAKYDYFIIFVSVAYSPWSDHVLDFWNLKDDPNVLFLTYEDMIEVGDYCWLIEAVQAWIDYT